MSIDELIRLFPEWVSHLFIQAIAGTLGGFTTTIITNPLDIVRARLQVQRLDSMFNTFKVLWVEERLQMFTKGLSARLVQSACFSFSIILGYETIKRFSIIEEYKGYIRWWIYSLKLVIVVFLSCIFRQILLYFKQKQLRYAPKRKEQDH